METKDPKNNCKKEAYYVCVKKSLDFGEIRTRVESCKSKYHNHYTEQPCEVTPQKISL